MDNTGPKWEKMYTQKEVDDLLDKTIKSKLEALKGEIKKYDAFEVEGSGFQYYGAEAVPCSKQPNNPNYYTTC